MSDATFRNGKRRPLRVNFFDLQPFHHGVLPDGDRGHKSSCPACPDGLLLMARDSGTGVLLAEDRCVCCGQAVVYDDIERVRKERP